MSYKYRDYRFLKKVALSSIYLKKNYFRKKAQLTMKKAILLFLTLTYFTNYAQTKFEKGYFINNSNEPVECFIKNLDLLYNPNRFSYKLDLNSEEIILSIKDAKVFEIYGVVKYERNIVNIDRSSEIGDEISVNRKAIFNEEQLFLKVLVEGKATLYKYAEPNLLRYFFKKDNSKTEQLVYKSYTDGFSSNIKKNERYKQQLLNNLTCEILSARRFNNLSYRKNSLTSIFIDYNKCTGIDYKSYTLKKNKKLQFNLSLKSGIRVSNFYIEVGNSRGVGVLDFERKMTPRFGIEAEFILPFNNNKWAIVVEPNYVYYNANFNDSKVSDRITDTDNSANIDYAAIDLPIGLRYYMFLNKNSKFFINYFVVPNFTIESKIRSTGDYPNILLNYNGKSDFNRAYGIGYNYKEKMSVEIRLSGSRDLLNNSAGNESFFYNFSLIFGYTIF